MIFYNDIGCGCAIVFFAIFLGVGWLVSLIWTDSDVAQGLVLMAASLLIVVGDLGFRASNNKETGFMRFVDPTTGGHIWFVPVYAWGSLGVVLGWQQLMS